MEDVDTFSHRPIPIHRIAEKGEALRVSLVESNTRLTIGEFR
jgi:hypothetical protein